MTRRAAGLGLVALAGAALRFATLDAQSLWYDEAVTAQLLRMDLAGMLQAIPDSESTPPLYYVLAWFWTHVAGTGEAGLRSLSAAFGVATIGVVWTLARRLGGDRAALLAAALVAFNPLLVWFSQEARAYALLALLGALSALLWLRALEQPRAAGRLLAWGAVVALAMATHYYAIFLVGPQALWLLVRAPGLRERAIALALPLTAAAALAPLALGQRAADKAAFIGDASLGTRLIEVPKQFLVAYDAPAEPLLVAVAALAVLVGLVGLRALLSGRGGVGESARDDAGRLLALIVAALLLPLAGALAGEDHFLTRNLLAALPPGCALVGAGLAAAGPAGRRTATLAATAACAAGAIAVLAVAGNAQFQRDDWRAAVAALGPIEEPRLIVATPDSALAPLRYYLPAIREARRPSFTTDEIDYIALPVQRAGQRERPKPVRPAHPATPGAAYTLAGRTFGETYTVLRWRRPAPAAEPVAPSPGLDGKDAALLSVTIP